MPSRPGANGSAIIGVLVALLLAMQAAREAARRMSCSNKLKQLALGAQDNQYFSDSVELTVDRALSTRAGGEIVPVP